MPGYVRNLGKRKDGSTKWQARWRPPGDPSDKARRERVFRLKRDGERWISDLDTDYMRSAYVDPRKAETRFAAVADAWRASWIGLEPKTRSGYESILAAHLLPEFGDRRVSTIAPERVERWVRALMDGGLAASTVRSIYAALRAALNTAVRLRMIAVNPCTGVKLPRAPKREQLFLTHEQVRALADAINPHYRVLVYTAAFTGMRAGELGGLRRRDVDLLRGRITVEQALKDLTGARRLPEEERRLIFGPTKTHSRRSITVPAFLRDMLAEHLTDSSHPGGTGADDLVFVTPTGTPIRQTNFYKREFKPVVIGRPAVEDKPAKRGRSAQPAKPAVPGALPAALRGFRFHDLRHTCASLLIAQGAHSKAIQEILGHESITMTLDLYGHMLPGLGDDLAARLDAAHSATLPDNVVELRRGLEAL